MIKPSTTTTSVNKTGNDRIKRIRIEEAGREREAEVQKYRVRFRVRNPKE